MVTIKQVAAFGLAAFIALATASCGCSSSEVTTGGDAASSAPIMDRQDTESSSSSTPSNTSTSKLMETDAVGEGDAHVTLVNDTASDFISLSIKPVGTSSWSQVFDNGFIVKSGTEFILSYTPSGNAKAYDLLLGCSDGSKISFKNVNLELQDLSLRYDKGIGYVSYTDDSGNSATNKEDAASAEADSAQDNQTYDQQTQAGD